MSYIPQQRTYRSSFDELLVTQPEPAIQLQFAYNINTDFLATASFGAGYVTASSGKAQIGTGASTNSTASLHTKDAMHYHPGQGADIRFSAIFTQGVTGSSQVIGYGDDLDGFYFGFSGSQFGALRRNNGTENWTPQTSWSADTMSGAGPSRMTLDHTKGNVYQIQFQWLGFGNIKYYVYDVNAGEFQLVHLEKYANSATVPSIRNPTLPLNIEANNTTNNTDIKVETASMACFIEGGKFFGGELTRNSVSGSVGSVTGLTNIFSITNNTTFSGQRNRVRIIPDLFSFSGNGAQDYTIRMILNPSTSGGFTDISANRSVIGINSSSFSPEDGRGLLTFALAKNTGEIIDLSHLNIRINPGEILTIAATAPGATIVSAALGIREEF